MVAGTNHSPKLNEKVLPALKSSSATVGTTTLPIFLFIQVWATSSVGTRPNLALFQGSEDFLWCSKLTYVGVIRFVSHLHRS